MPGQKILNTGIHSFTGLGDTDRAKLVSRGYRRVQRGTGAGPLLGEAHSPSGTGWGLCEGTEKGT